MNGLLNILQNRFNSAQTFIIGIDGLGGAGKTTFTESLHILLQKQNYNVQTLHLDDFIHKKLIRYDKGTDTVDCYYDLQWRYDYLVNQILEPLRRFNCLEKDIEIYDKDNDEYIYKHLRILKKTFLLLEGIFLQKSELIKYFDFVIYIDTPKDVRYKRVLSRDRYIGDINQITSKYENRYFPAEDKYEKRYAPKRNADYLIQEIEIIRNL